MKRLIVILLILLGLGSKGQTFEEIKSLAYQGNERAQYNLALSFYTGELLEQNIDSAVFWFTKSAEAGVAFAQYNLGLIYHQGSGVRKNDVEAEKWFLMAARHYDDECQSGSRGDAVQWFTLAALQNYPDAQNMLGNVYLSGEGATVDYQKALKWYKLAAVEGHPVAMFNLGYMYYYGRGVYPNKTIAAHWIKKAMSAGNNTAKEFWELRGLEKHL